MIIVAIPVYTAPISLQMQFVPLVSEVTMVRKKFRCFTYLVFLVISVDGMHFKKLFFASDFN